MFVFSCDSPKNKPLYCSNNHAVEFFFEENFSGLKGAYTTFETMYTEDPKLRTSNAPRSQLSFNALTPLWSKAQKKVNPGLWYDFIYVPLAADFARMPIHDSFVGRKINTGMSAPVSGFLVRYIDRDFSLLNSTFFLLYLPERKYHLSHELLEITPGDIPDDFTGDLDFFDLSGQLKEIHHYKNGILTQKETTTYLLSDLLGTNVRAQNIETCITTVYTTDYYFEVYAGDDQIGDTEYIGTTYETTQECYTNVIIGETGGSVIYGSVGGGGGGASGRPNLSELEKKHDELLERYVDFFKIIKDFGPRSQNETVLSDGMTQGTASIEMDIGTIIEQLSSLYDILNTDPILSKLFDEIAGDETKMVSMLQFINGNINSHYNPENKTIYLNITEGSFEIAFIEELTHHLQNIAYTSINASLSVRSLAIEAEAKFFYGIILNRIAKALENDLDTNIEGFLSLFRNTLLERTYFQSGTNLFTFSKLLSGNKGLLFSDIPNISVILSDFQEFLSTSSLYSYGYVSDTNWSYELINKALAIEYEMAL